MPEKPTYEQLQTRIAQLEKQLAQCRQNLSPDSEQDLFVKLERFRLAFYTSPDAININRLPDGSYIDINEGFTELTGYTREDLLEKPSLHINIWKNPQDRKRLVKLLLQSESVTNFEACIVTKDGTLKYGLLSARLLEMNNEKVMLSVARDITALKEAQRIVAESEQQLKAFIENSPDIFFVHDVQGRIVQVNQQACHALGWSREEFSNKSILDIQQVEPADTAAKRLQTVADGNVAFFETQYARKDGTRIPVEVNLSSVRFNDRVLIFGFARDITERKALEQEREKIRKRLILAQRLESIGTLAGGVAHDFNNLLMGIQGRASVMSYELNSDHPCFEHVNAIMEYSRSATHLTKQLLGIARGGKYEVKPIDLNELLLNSSTTFGRTKKEIRIHSKLQNPAPVVAADPRQIEQVLINLYINAWQAMPKGGDLYLQTATVVLDDDFCTTHAIKPGSYAKVSITDTGIGMEKNIQTQIFDPFFTTKEKSRGTGLGLASAYGIIKNHNGLIDVYSEPGHGTTFNIYLPISEMKVAQETLPRPGFEKGTETILLVDDEQMVLDVGQTMLQKMGYTAITAQGGRSAIALLNQSNAPPDLIVLDLIMPDVSGEKAFEAIREIHPNLPILLASGYSINDQARQILDKGGNGFIQKPFNMDELSRKIREVLDNVKG